MSEAIIKWLVEVSNNAKELSESHGRADFARIDAACTKVISQLSGFEVPGELVVGMSRMDEFAMSAMHAMLTSGGHLVWEAGDLQPCMTRIAENAVYIARTLEHKLDE